MGRLSNVVIEQYPTTGTQDVCEFCGGEAKMWELTPHPRASAEHVAAFQGEKCKVRVCEPCWAKVHRVNWIERGERYGVERGCLTLTQKRHLCTGQGSIGSVVKDSRFVMGFSDMMIVPNGTMRDTADPTIFFQGSTKWTVDEIMALQGPMALRMVGAPTEAVAKCFWMLVNDPSGDLFDLEKYVAILEIPHSE